MPENKLTHEEADRRLMEAMKPPKQSGVQVLDKLRKIAAERNKTIGQVH